jgi:integrase
MTETALQGVTALHPDVTALHPDVTASRKMAAARVRLQEAARKRSRYGHRDATMILVAYRHGPRASEVCNLRWDQIDLGSGRFHVRRAKGGIDTVHRLSGKEIRALRQLRRERISICVCNRAGRSGHHRRIPENDRPNWRGRKAVIPSSSSHASALNWVQARQRWA